MLFYRQSLATTGPAIHGVHERPAATAEELGQQHAGHDPDPCKVVQDDRCRDESGPQAVERDIRQQDEGFRRQRAEVGWMDIPIMW